MSLPTLFDYLPRASALALCKLAEGEQAAGQPEKKPNAAMPVLKTMAGMGVGTLAGAGLAHYTDKLYQHATGQRIPAKYLATALPILGGGLGLAYNLMQAHQMEEMRRGIEGSRDSSDGRVP